MTGLRSFSRLLATATRVPSERAASRSRRAWWPEGLWVSAGMPKWGLSRSKVCSRSRLGGWASAVRCWRAGWVLLPYRSQLGLAWFRVGLLPIQGSFLRGGWGGCGLCVAAARAHPMDTVSRSGGRRRPWRSPPLRCWFADRAQRRRGMGAFGAGGLPWAAGMGQPDLAARSQSAMGLAGFLGQQPAALRRRKQPLVDLALDKRAGGDQVVEVAGRLPQLPVAVADRGGGDAGELLGQGRPRISVC